MNKSWLAIAGVTVAAGALGFYSLSPRPDDGSASPAPSAGVNSENDAQQVPEPPSATSVERRAVTGSTAAPNAEDEDPTEDIEDAEAVDQAGIKLSVMNAVRGLDRPRRTLGEPATAAAMEAIDMAELAVDDARYDPVIEAHQLFNAFEVDVLSRGQLDEAAWQELVAKYEPAKQSMLERSVELAHGGEADASESLLLEWNALEAGYQEQVE